MEAFISLESGSSKIYFGVTRYCSGISTSAGSITAVEWKQETPATTKANPPTNEDNPTGKLGWSTSFVQWKP